MRKVAVLVAIGANADGHREILGICDGMQEDKESWLSFIRHLKSRGLSGVRQVVSDKCLCLVEAVSQCFPRAEWQRCVFHFHRNILSKVSREQMPEVAAMLKPIHAQEDHKAAMEKAAKVRNNLLTMRLRPAAEVLEAGMGEALTYMSFPREHWIRIRTNNTMKGSTGRSAGGPGSSATSPMGSPRSCWWPQGSGMSRQHAGDPEGIWTWTDFNSKNQPRRIKPCTAPIREP